MTCRATLLTPRTPGAVAIVQLHGGDAASILQQLTGKTHWHPGRLRLCDFAGIDQGLAVLLPGDLPSVGSASRPSSGRRPENTSQYPARESTTGGPPIPPEPPHDSAPSTTAQLMPHGGPRVVQRLLAHLTESLGVVYDPTPDPRVVYPEAASAIEADLLDAIARAASPAAIDLLADQPRRWSALLTNSDAAGALKQKVAARSLVLDQLLTPPTVVVIGPANAGKSTLTNRLMGRSVSIVADLPGTTRDWVGGLVELNPGVSVNWLDTPGLRDSTDPIEQRAIALARRVIAQAAVIIALRDPEQGWPELSWLSRSPDLWVMNKVDDAGDKAADGAEASPSKPLPISAEWGGGVRGLERRVVECLGLAELSLEPWAFSPQLRAWCAGQDDLAGYLG